MSVFPKKAIREISSQAALNPFEGDTEGTRATGFLDVVPAVFNSFMTEDLSVSEIRNRAPIVKGQFRIMRELTGNKRWDINNFDFPGQDQAFQQIVDSEDEIRGFQEIAPGRGLLRADEIREQIRLLAADARRRRDDVLSRAGDKARFFGQLVGVGAAAMTDPINVASLPFAAASGAGLVRVALTAAGINVATEAAIQATAVYDYKKELRAPYSIGEAVFNTFAAGVAGGVLEGGVRGIGRAITAISEKTLARTASKAVDSGKVKPNARTRAAIEVLEENDELHRTNPFPEQGPAGQAAHVEAMAETQSAVVDGRIADVDDIVRDVREGGTTAGQPATFRSFDPGEIAVDAETFQFKGGGDATGLTDRLAGIEKFDETKAGVVIVYEKKNGSLFIVDGHQRLGLASRAQAAGQADVRLNAMVFRESAGVTPSDVRRIAAARNIAEGTGSALDAAKVIREAGSIEDLNLPPKSVLVRDARGLSKLGDDAFREVINRTIDERYAAIIGSKIDDPAEQLAAVGVLKQTEPANRQQAELIVDQVRASSFVTEETGTLFGTEQLVSSLFKPRARILDVTLRRLRRDKRLFSLLVDREADIAEAGRNVLDRGANEQAIENAGMALGYISSLANSKGPLSDALNAAAKLEQATGNKTKAGKQFLEELYRLLESGEIHLAESVTPPKIDVAPGQTALFGDAIDSVSMNETEAMDALITARRGALAEDAIDAERARLTDDAKRLAKRLGVTDWQDDIELSRKLREGIENDPQAARFGLEDPPHPLPDDHPLLRDTSTINTKERQEMRAQWIEDHFKSKEPVPKDEQPILVMMGGGAASGKGRVKRVLRAGGKLPAEKNTVFIDADEVKEVIPEFKRLVAEGDARAAPTVHEESSKVAKGALGQAFSRRHHVMLDGTMGNPRKMARVIREAKAAGYEVRVVGVTIDPDEALLRMYTRGRLTGRWVPVNRLLEAHAAFSRNFEKFAKAADQADLFDNSGETAINVAAKARGGKLRILDETANTRFNNKGKLSGKEDTIQELRETVEGKKLARGGVLEEGVEAGREGAAGGRAEEGARQPSGVHGDLDPEPVTDPLTGDAVDIAAQRRGEFDELVEQHGDQLQLPTGEVDAQGRPLTRPAAEVVAEIDNEAGRIRSLLDCMRA